MSAEPLRFLTSADPEAAAIHHCARGAVAGIALVLERALQRDPSPDEMINVGVMTLVTVLERLNIAGAPDKACDDIADGVALAIKTNLASRRADRSFGGSATHREGSA